MTTHRLLVPDASDLRYRCAGCGWTASAVFMSEQERHDSFVLHLAGGPK